MKLLQRYSMQILIYFSVGGSILVALVISSSFGGAEGTSLAGSGTRG